MHKSKNNIDQLVFKFAIILLKHNKAVIRTRAYERGAGVAITLRPMDSRGPITGAQQKAYQNDTEKSACGGLKTFFFCFFGGYLKILRKLWHFSLKTFFFFEITSKFGQNCGIFPVCFGVHKTRTP